MHHPGADAAHNPDGTWDVVASVVALAVGVVAIALALIVVLG